MERFKRDEERATRDSERMDSVIFTLPNTLHLIDHPEVVQYFEPDPFIRATEYARRRITHPENTDGPLPLTRTNRKRRAAAVRNRNRDNDGNVSHGLSWDYEEEGDNESEDAVNSAESDA
jgi:hypothetical protein